MIFQKCILSTKDVALVAAIAKEKAEFLGRTRARSTWSRKLGWPAAMLVLTFLTGPVPQYLDLGLEKTRV
jgi:hypothetical protein